MVRPTPSVSRNTLGSNECFRFLFAKLVAFFKVDPPRFRNLAGSDETANPDCEGYDPLSIKMPGRGLSNIAQSGAAPGPDRFSCFPRGRAGSSRRQFAGEVFPIGMDRPRLGLPWGYPTSAARTTPMWACPSAKMGIQAGSDFHAPARRSVQDRHVLGLRRARQAAHIG